MVFQKGASGNPGGRKKSPPPLPEPPMQQEPQATEATEPRLLIAVVSCHERQRWTDAQRATWMKDVPAELADVRFFVGRGENGVNGQVMLQVYDHYEALPEKVQAVCQWAIQHDYEQMLKLDDDTLVWPTRVLRPAGNYVGWVQEPAADNWCAGMAYWLRRPAMEAILRARVDVQSTAEDRWVGKVLKQEGIRAERDRPGVIQWVGRARPLPQNVAAILSSAYVAGEFTPEEMPKFYVY